MLAARDQRSQALAAGDQRGPALTLLERGEFLGLQDLRLSLTVDGVQRQDRPAADMIHRTGPGLIDLGSQDCLVVAE